MSKQKLQPEPPSVAGGTMPQHDAQFNTFGLQEVAIDEARLDDVIYADYYGKQHQAYAGRLKSNLHPDTAGVKRTLGKLVGKSLRTPGEQDFLDAYAENREEVQDRSDTFRDSGVDRQELVTNLLDHTREKLRELEPVERDRFNSYAASSVPRFVRDSRKITEKEQDIKEYRPWSEWFSERASDDQLLNFLQWHVRQIDTQQTSPELETKIYYEKREYQMGVLEGVEDGWLYDEQTAVSVNERIDEIKVRVGDEFDTTMQDRGGYHFRGSQFVVIAQGIGDDPERMIKSLESSVQHVLKHEYNHALLENSIFDRWLSEALTEHIALILNGNRSLENVNPHSQGLEKVGGYPDERSLLDVLVRFGEGPVPVGLFTRYYSCPEDELESSGVAKELNETLEAAWGHPNVIEMVGQKIVEYRTEELAKNGGTLKKAEIVAINRVRSDLLQQPAVIFEADQVAA